MRKIYVIREGEPLPLKGSTGRFMRAGTIANMLANRDNDTTWITSSYMHYQKKYITNKAEERIIDNGLKLKLLHSKHGYSKNISFERIKYCRDMGKLLKESLESMPKPDVIFCSWPIIEFSYEATLFANKNNIPIIVDIRDLWPDIFIQPLPSIIKPLGKLAVDLLYKKKVTYVMKNATSIIGVNKKNVEFAEEKGRVPFKEDEVVYLSYTKSNEINSSDEIKLVANKIKDKFVVIFIGNIGNRVNDFTLIESVINDTRLDKDVEFVFCGIGPYYNEFKTKFKNNRKVHIVGRLDQSDLVELMKVSNAGLLPYHNTFDFRDSLPNKVGEYLSEGLPILTSLSGLPKQVLESNNAGVYYNSNNELVNIIQKLKKDKELYSKMRHSALDLFENEFNAKVVYGNLCKKLENMGVMENNE